MTLKALLALGALAQCAALQCGAPLAALRRPLAPRRSRDCRAAEAEPPEDALGEELQRELREALSGLGDAELTASEERQLDNLLETKKAEMDSLVSGELSRQLDELGEAMDARIEGRLAGLKAEAQAKMDAAVDELKGSMKAAQAEMDAATGARAAPADEGVPSAELPADARVVVAGAASALGAELISFLAASQPSWTLVALLKEGEAAPSGLPAAVETAPFAPFAPSALKRSMDGADAIVVVSKAVGGNGGVDPEAMKRLMDAVDDSVSRLVAVSPHGVERTGELPYSLANALGGKLDKQRAAEQEMVLRARRGIAGHAVVRVGKLRPATATAPSERELVCEISPREDLGGEVGLRPAAAALAAALTRPEAVNATFSVGAYGGDVASAADAWDDEFLKLVGPEIYRRPLGPALPAVEMSDWLREWARGFLKPGRGLTTKVSVGDVDGGAILRFIKSDGGYADYDAEDADDDWGKSDEKKPPKPDGALLLLAEGAPASRVRVVRAEMEEGVVVKEMSEASVLSRLQKDLDALEKARRSAR